MLVPLEFDTLMLLNPGEAAGEIENNAVADVESTTLKLLTLIPLPVLMLSGPTKFVPLRVTRKDEFRAP